MFKVGDKGKTLGGFAYAITSTTGKSTHCRRPQPLEATIYTENGEETQSFFADGMFCNGPNDYDLLPPESHEEVEMPEYLPEEIEATAEHEYDNFSDHFHRFGQSELEDMAIIASVYDVTITSRVGEISYTVTRTNSDS